FLWQWLVARTLNDFPIREVFTQFKHYVTTSANDVQTILRHIRTAADKYRSVIEASENPNGVLSRVELFSYRVGLLDSEVARPLPIWAARAEQASIPSTGHGQILGDLGRRFVRRSLVKASTKGSNRFIIDLLRRLSHLPADQLVQSTREY